MVSAKRRAFSLVELLVVVTILAVLISLLLPVLAGAWQTAYMTQCRDNLRTIYAALCLRQTDTNTALYANGQGWNSVLLPYVENRLEVFRCPASAGLVETTAPAASSATTNSGGTGGYVGTEATSGGPAPILPGFDISFNVYSSPAFTNLDWNVSFNSSVWCRQTANYDAHDPGMPASGTWRYQIENRGFLVEQTGNWAWADDYADIDVAVTYENGLPAQIKIIQAKNGSQARRADMLINGSLVVHDIDAHQGLIINLRPPATQTSGTAATAGSQGSSGVSSTAITTFVFVPCDYGMSVGSYSVPNTEAGRIDPRLFLILDYPKRLADYNTSGEDYASWDKYFIEDPRSWQAIYGGSSNAWATYQSLRHFQMANVLFCDGHVESLGLDPPSSDARSQGLYLRPESPLWRYGAR
jgi:prepilin-type N-terminal cleavage/methylation domain-containing protein/prepilin-type processing-associated H-X9-DG protein